MRFTHSFLFRVVITASLLLGFPIHGAFAVSYPVTTPAGEQAGGWFQTYFDNMYTAPCGVNQFLNGFTISGVLLCSTPGIYVAGVLGQTLYYDGTDWVATSNIWNDNTNVGIGTAVPGAKLDVNGDALINSLILGRGSGSIASNTAFGYQTFFSNVTGINNVGIGYQTLYSNVSGFGNSALGYRALRNTLGDNNTGFGFESLYTNITGINNTAYGVNSLYLNSIGSNNTALGYGALSALTSGDYNIAIGSNAEVPSNTGSGQLSIGNWIYGSGGIIGIGTGSLNTAAKLKIAGQIEITGGNPGAGKVLASDATGLASWTGIVTATSLNLSGSAPGSTIYYDGTDWIPNVNIYNLGGNVGIGTSLPGAKLEVNGQVKITGGSVSSGRILTTDATGLAYWADPGVASSVTASGITGGASGYLSVFGTGGNGLYPSLLFQSGTRMGIGTMNPSAELDIVGQIKISGGTPGIGKVLTSDATGLASWGNPAIATSVYATGVLAAYGSGGYITQFMPYGTGITSSIIYQSGSYIGIGNTTPGYNLDVTGTFRNTGNAIVGGTIQILGGSPGIGKVLTSDATGLASWTTVSASTVYATGVIGAYGSGGYLTKFMTNGTGITSAIVFESGSYIGIGNTNPGYTLDVSGTGNFVGLRLPTGAASGYILTSDTSGNMRWMTNNYIETDPQVGANTTNYVSKWDGSSLVTSQIFDNGTSVGIGTGVPGIYRLNVNGDTYIGGSITVSGSVITDKIVNRTVSNVSISGSLLPDTSAPMMYRDIGNDTTASWNNLYLSGQIKIKGGTPGLGKILMSDANGLATWTTYASGATATGITGGASGYLSVFGAGGNGLYSSLLFQTGTRIGIGNTTPGYTLDVSGTGNFVGLRLPTGASNNYILTSDASGNARWSALVSSSNTVYATGVIGAYGSGGYITKFMTNGTGITSSLLFETGGRIGLGTTIPQYMFDMRGSGSILNAGSGLCIDGVCINAWSGLNNLVRSTGTPDYIAKFNSGGVIDNSQIYETGGNLYIGDISGIISGSATIGYITIEAAGSTNSANPFLTLSENGGQECRMWITGANKLGSNCSWTAGLGGSYEPNQIIRADSAGTELTGSTLYQVGNFFGFGNSSPNSRFEIWTGSSVSPLQHFRGIQNVGLGQNGLNPAVTGSRNIGIGVYALSGMITGSRNIGIGSLAGASITQGAGNVMIGSGAGYNISSGSNNIAIGSDTSLMSAITSNQLNIGNWIYGSGGKIGIGTGSLSTTAILKVAGQVEITGGSPGLGKVLTSDANGFATWSNTISGATATGITGGTQNYLSKFGTGGTGLYISQIIDTGTGIGVGATGGVINTKFVIDSGVDDDSGLRLSRLDINSPLTSNGVLALGINSSGKVLPISPISNIAVYTGVLRTTALSPNPDLNTFDITYNFNQYFAIPGKQSFVVSKGDGPSYNGPYFKENGTSALCSITGTYGTSPYDCINPDPVTGLSASPYNSFTMTAKGDTFGYQLALGARGDAPLFARSGRFNGSQTGGLYTNDSPYQTPAPWQRVLSLPANHPEYLYINTGLNSQLQSQTGAGNVGIGTTVPNSRFEVWTGATTQTLFHFRGLENVGIGLNSLNITLTGRRNVALGVNGLDVVTSGSYNVAIGSNAGNTLTTGSNNIMIGSGANVVNTGSNQLNIGNWIYGSGGYISVGRSDPQSNFEAWSGGTSTLVHFRGTDNVGFGLNAARYQASGTANSAFGDDALRTDTTGYSNTALGASSLYSNQTGFFNTAGGTQSLYTNQDGTWNVALGSQALYTNLGGDYNIGIGGQSLYLNSSGNDSIGLGYQALRASLNGMNIGIGTMAGSGITTGTGNIMIGYRVQANNNTANNQLNIGNWIYGSGGYIGIGTATPGAKLEVNGQIKITGGSPGAGKVLTSDASGLATWQTPSGSGGGGGGVTGGQANYTARWLDATTLGTGALTDDGTNVGIGTASPGSKLGVNGTFRLGTNGTQLNAIIKATVNKDYPSIANNACSAQTFTVTNAQTGGSVIVSPASAITDGLMITYARVSAASTVEVKICNESGASVNLSAMDFYITVIQ